MTSRLEGIGQRPPVDRTLSGAEQVVEIARGMTAQERIDMDHARELIAQVHAEQPELMVYEVVEIVVDRFNMDPDIVLTAAKQYRRKHGLDAVG